MRMENGVVDVGKVSPHIWSIHRYLNDPLSVFNNNAMIIPCGHEICVGM